MYNIEHNNLDTPVKDMFEISNNEFHNLRSNAVDFHIPKPNTLDKNASESANGL